MTTELVVVVCDPMTANEYQALADLNRELAAAYQATADDPREERDIRDIAGCLAAWRKERARLFQEEAARAERAEAREEANLPDPVPAA